MAVPCLELLGAVLLAQLVRQICKTLQFPLQEVATFSDSTIVLAWLKGPSSRFQIFVKNWVDFVHLNLPAHQWRFVPTKENPVDLLTRGVPVHSLVSNPLCINSPEWLKWPELDHRDYQAPLEIPEHRKIKVCSTMQKEEVITEDLLARWLAFNKLIRVVSRLLQFRSCIFKNQEAPALNVRALNALYKVSQLIFFRKEIIQLNSNQLKSSKGQLKALNPFLDAQGMLRVGGRVSNSSLAYDTKHPVILGRRSVLANLLAHYIHEGYYHSTVSFTINFLQSKYWIHGGVSKLVKKIVRECVWCTRVRAQTAQQIMGDLPSERVKPSRPFIITGVDFAGVFTVKCTNHRTWKYLNNYAAIFVCFSTKAVHIEQVTCSTAEVCSKEGTAKSGVVRQCDKFPRSKKRARKSMPEFRNSLKFHSTKVASPRRLVGIRREVSKETPGSCFQRFSVGFGAVPDDTQSN